MKALVVSASRYGSADQAAGWIAERLALSGLSVEVYKADNAPAPGDEQLVVLGSGLYAHKMLPALDKYIDRHLDLLSSRQIALFALAMRTSPVFVRGQVHGGLSHLDYLFRKLGPAVIHAEMLGGQMTFDNLSQEDQKGLERFYAMLKLSPAELAERKKPRTLMNKIDYWKFAEDILRKMQGTS